MDLKEKLHPKNFPGISATFTAFVGCILGIKLTSPQIVALCVTRDGYLLARKDGEDEGFNHWVGNVNEFQQAWERYLNNAGLTMDESKEADHLYVKALRPVLRERLGETLLIVPEIQNIRTTPFVRGRLVCAGPVTRQPATVTFRVVLVLSDNCKELIVWNQVWVDDDPNTDLKDEDSSFSDGSYFRLDQFPEAMSKFAYRIDKPEQYRSLFRTPQQETDEALTRIEEKLDTD
jgi:hypothetical protein